MRSLSVRFAVMLATAAVAPLLVYGAVSVYSLREGTHRTVVDGSANVARQVGEQVRRYVRTNLQIFQALVVDLANTDLTLEQQDHILKNFVLRFPEFRELTVFDRAKAIVASSAVGPPRLKPPVDSVVGPLGVAMSPVFVDDDVLPTSFVTLPFSLGSEGDGWLVGEFSIEELWRMVDRIRVGDSGVALIVGPGGVLLAHGNPSQRPLVARGTKLSDHPVVAALAAVPGETPVVREFRAADGQRMLAVGVRVPELGWFVLVEQPTREAYATAMLHERELLAAIGLALLIMILVGSIWARSLIRPIVDLTAATGAIAEGRLEQRVTIRSVTELSRLGQGFNRMADRLVELQDDVRRQERHAVFGKVAAGLVHDLSHPFKNIQNNCRLVLKMHDDQEYRELFRRTVEREFATVKRVFEDLHNIVRPMPVERFPVDLNKLAADVVETMRLNADTAGLSLELKPTPEDAYVEGDIIALGRVLRNLVLNAIEATPPLGRVTVATDTADGFVRLQVSDTGCGIPPERIATLFDDFQTTKRQGLGLGLASSKKIVEQLGGTIRAERHVAKGAVFVVELARVRPPRRAVG
ncbi:MAG: sensor histidine kinase [Acidobacteriota bacterium]